MYATSDILHNSFEHHTNVRITKERTSLANRD